MKIFKTSDDIVELVEEQFQKTGLQNYGLHVKCMSLTKSNDIIKVAKESATTQFLTKSNDSVHMFIYEEAFDRLGDDAKLMLIEMALSNVSYDTEKEKLNIDTNPFNQLFRMRKKYGDTIMDKLELAAITIEEIAEEEKERKEAEKEAKKAAKKNNN